MLSVGDEIVIPPSEAIDLASGRVSGRLQVLDVITGSGEPLLNLGREGRLTVSSIPLSRIEQHELLISDLVAGLADGGVAGPRDGSGTVSDSGADRPRDRDEVEGRAVGLAERGLLPDGHCAAAVPAGVSPGVADRRGGSGAVETGDRVGGVDRVQEVGSGARRVVVFDHLNLLVRSWHVGQPSDIHAVRGMLATVRLTIETLQPSVVVFACEGGHGYRRQLLPTYKSSRTKPEGLQEQIDLGLQAIDAIGWPALRAEGYEADDVAATIATQRSSAGDDVIIVSTDKDLLQLTTLDGVRVFDPYKAKAFVSDESIRERWGVEPSQIGDLLALAGDASDEIPGVPGIGPKTAADLLAGHRDLDGILEAARLRATMKTPKYWSVLHAHRDDALVSRRLVTLQTNAPIPTGWIDWPALNPRVMWLDKLRQLGLGSSAGKLGDVFGDVRRSESRLITPDLSTQPGYRPADWREIDAAQFIETQTAPRSDAASHPTVSGAGRFADKHTANEPPLRPDERCDSGLTAGQHYQSGVDWRTQSPRLAAQADAGTISPVSLWGAQVGNWARYWWAGATGKPFPTEGNLVTPPSERPVPTKSRTLF